MQSSLLTTHRIELVLGVQESKALNELTQRIWNTKPGQAGGSPSALVFTDAEYKVLESLYQHTAVSASLEG